MLVAWETDRDGKQFIMVRAEKLRENEQREPEQRKKKRDEAREASHGDYTTHGKEN